VLIAAFSILMVDRARAASIDEHVISVDSPVPDEHSSTESSPAITGDLVFWADTRPVSGYASFPRIFFRDLARPDEPERMLTPQPDYFSGYYRGQYQPVAGDGVIAWKEMVKTAAGSSAYEVRFINLDECESPDSCAVHRVPVQQPLMNNLSAGSGKIVWEGYASSDPWQTDIYEFDQATGAVTAVCTASSQQSEPAVSGDWIVWVDNRGGSFENNGPTKNDLYARNMASGEERRLTFDEGAVFQQTPVISGNLVVFHELKNIGVTYSIIKAIDLVSGAATPVFDGKGVNQRPFIDGGMVVWENCPINISSCRIWMLDTATGLAQPVSSEPDSGPLKVQYPAMSSGRVVWLDYRSTVWTVYQSRIGETARALADRYRPELHFRHDVNDLRRGDFEPRPASLLVDVPGTRLVKGDSSVLDPSLDQMAAGTDADSFIDLTGDPWRDAFADYSEPYLNQLSIEPPRYPITAHARVVPNAEGSHKTVIQYWLCYYFNNWINNHEGDWELVEIVMNEDLEPEKAAYSQHSKAFVKGWNEEGLSRAGTHPLVFVAEGSHANYFENGAWGTHYHQGKLDKTGDASSSSVELDVDGLAAVTGWSAFAGRWGEVNRWWPPVWLPPFVEGGPGGPVCQGGAWEAPLSWADGDGAKADDNDLLVEVFGSLSVMLTDGSGRFAGDGDQAAEGRIPFSDYFQRASDASDNIVVHDTDITGAYHLVLTAVKTGQSGLRLKLPDFAGGTVQTVTFQGLDLPSGSRGILELNRAVPMLDIDYDGDGKYEAQLLPTERSSAAIDFTPPEPVKDLAAASSSSESVTLSWTASAEAGQPGGEVAYEIRYAQDPITADNWPAAKPAGELRVSLSPGSPQQFTVSGLDAGSRYFFAILARDGAWQPSALSNTAAAVTQSPRLTWSRGASFWASLSDYRDRRLTVAYLLSNSGSQTAAGAAIEASFQTEGAQVLTPLPMLVGDLDPGSSREVKIAYAVPTGKYMFRTTTYATCLDDAGRSHWYPGAPPVG